MVWGFDKVQNTSHGGLNGAEARMRSPRRPRLALSCHGFAIGIFDRSDESCSPMSGCRTDSRISLNGAGQAIGIRGSWKRNVKHPATGVCSGWALSRSGRASEVNV